MIFKKLCRRHCNEYYPLHKYDGVSLVLVVVVFFCLIFSLSVFLFGYFFFLFVFLNWNKPEELTGLYETLTNTSLMCAGVRISNVAI